MGLSLSFKEEKSMRLRRGAKATFFLARMVVTLLVFSAPIGLAIADTLLLSALLSVSRPPSTLSLPSLRSHLRSYDFRRSLIDVPLLSFIRSALIICVYSLCHGPELTEGPYVGVATACSVLSLAFVSLKLSYAFGGRYPSGTWDLVGSEVPYPHGLLGERGCMAVALLLCSAAMAVSHAGVAYRTSCRERRKVLVYKFDIEAAQVSAAKKRFPGSPVILEAEAVG